MSDQKPRAPRTFNLDAIEGAAETAEPAPKKLKPKKTARKPRIIKNKTIIRQVPDEAAQRRLPEFANADAISEQLTPPLPVKERKRFKWSKLFFGALGALLSLALGLWVDTLIRDLFARQDWLGWVAVALTGLLIIAALAIAVRELWGLFRMAAIEKIRERAAKAHAENNSKSAQSVIAELESIYAARPDTARGRSALEAHRGEIIDGRDLIDLAERDLMKPLDARAQTLVMNAAKRVSVVTAVSPRALVDIGYVLVENTRLIRALAELYGGRPGTLGFWRLTRNVIGHLAVTGSIAVGEGLVQQLVGHGLAAKLSARLGEGVVNGLLTARIGIAAIDVCRPLPFSDQHRPTVKDFMSELMRFSQKEPTES